MVAFFKRILTNWYLEVFVFTKWLLLLLQDSIVQQVNGNPGSGWKAAANPRLANFTVSTTKTSTYIFLHCMLSFQDFSSSSSS